MIRVSDYIAKTLADYGIRHVFMVTGGGAMHLNDAIGKEKRIEYICNHHEQACAMAAEGYARLTGTIGVINVTTGPGGINALNGVFGTWVDSIPMLVVSGQVKRETLLSTYDLPNLRQLGDQEADLIAMVKGMTKYAMTVVEPQTIAYHLEKALYLAQSGRQGPCWLDIPIDVQGALIDESQLKHYESTEEACRYDLQKLPEVCRQIIEQIQSAKRPVIMVGTGIRLAKAVEIFDAVIKKLRIPVTTAWTAHDLMASDDPLYCGRPGTVGDRPGNFTVQNSDLLLVIGCRLNIRQVSYNWKSFARHAFKIQVDADLPELNKPTVKPDLAVHCDARLFLEELYRQMDAVEYGHDCHRDWLQWCKERVVQYPVLLQRHIYANEVINPYYFFDILFRKLSDNDAIVCGDGTACVIPFQVGHIKKGQRMFCNSGCASMGYDLPASIGAAVAREGERVICLAGDGSVQLNIQELQTIKHHQLNIKIFVLNNGGYLSIRQTQQNFFGRLVGEGPSSGVSFPDMVKIAMAYGIPSYRIQGKNFGAEIENVLNHQGPVLAEVMLDPAQEFEPKLSSKQLADGKIVSAPLEDLYPFLERDEFFRNIIVKEIEE